MSRKRAKMLLNYLEKKEKLEKRKKLFEAINQIDKNRALADNNSTNDTKNCNFGSRTIQNESSSESCDEISIFSNENDKKVSVDMLKDLGIKKNARNRVQESINSVSADDLSSLQSECPLPVGNPALLQIIDSKLESVSKQNVQFGSELLDSAQIIDSNFNSMAIQNTPTGSYQSAYSRVIESELETFDGQDVLIESNESILLSQHDIIIDSAKIPLSVNEDILSEAIYSDLVCPDSTLLNNFKKTKYFQLQDSASYNGSKSVPDFSSQIVPSNLENISVNTNQSQTEDIVITNNDIGFERDIDSNEKSSSLVDPIERNHPINANKNTISQDHAFDPVERGSFFSLSTDKQFLDSNSSDLTFSSIQTEDIQKTNPTKIHSKESQPDSHPLPTFNQTEEKRQKNHIVTRSYPCKKIQNPLPVFNRTKEIQQQRIKLPIFYHESSIISLLKKHTSIFIVSTTGTGKTTQIPQFILENGINATKKICITLPRRILATLLSKRLNIELNTNIAHYKIKYEDTTNSGTVIKTMTEGVLLREIQADFFLQEYSVIILDEIHERSANLDILLGLLCKIVSFRKKNGNELKIVFMSASNILEVIRKVWDTEIGFYEVESEFFKVFTRYENFTDQDYVLSSFKKITQLVESAISSNHTHDRRTTKKVMELVESAISSNHTHDRRTTKKVMELVKNTIPTGYTQSSGVLRTYPSANHIKKSKKAGSSKREDSKYYNEHIADGDTGDTYIDTLNLPKDIVNSTKSSILCFLPSKDDIYRLVFLLINSTIKNEIRVYPFHASLSKYEQEEILKSTTKRKIIIATNIAETSITIPDIVFVIDSGKQKYKQFLRNNLYKYKIDFISKQNALQRKGRCGRTQNGVCYRLYSYKMYELFDETSIPGILNEDLSRPILFLKNLDIDFHTFPLINKPHDFMLQTGFKLLKDIGALDSNGSITSLGKILCFYPLNPLHSRLLTLKTQFCNELILLSCILSIDFEFSGFDSRFEYKSDLLMKLDFMLQYHKSENKSRFLRVVSSTQISEITKLYGQISKIYRKLNNLDLHYELADQISIEMQNEFVEFLAGVFHSNIAKKHGENFYLNDEEYSVSNHSVDVTHAKNIVFSHLVEGKTKVFMKDITIIDDILPLRE